MSANLGQKFVEFTRGEITFHLRIPLVIVPRMKARGNFRPFLQAKTLQRLFDLLQARVGVLILPGQNRKAH